MSNVNLGRILFGLTLLVVMALGGFFLPQVPEQARNQRGTPLPYPTHVVTTPIVVPPTPVPPTKTPMWAPTKVPTIGPPIQATQVPTGVPSATRTAHPTNSPGPLLTATVILATRTPAPSQGRMATPTPTVSATSMPGRDSPAATSTDVIVLPKYLPRTGEQS